MKGPNYFRPNIAGILENHDPAASLNTTEVCEDLPLSKLAWSVAETQLAQV